MTSSSLLAVIGIVYPTYYGINIAYDVIVYYKKKAKQEKHTKEYDLSHLNAQNEPVHQPKKVSEILDIQVEPKQPLTPDGIVVASPQPIAVSLDKKEGDATIVSSNQPLPSDKIGGLSPQPIGVFLDEKDENLMVEPSSALLNAEKVEIENPHPIAVPLDENEQILAIAPLNPLLTSEKVEVENPQPIAVSLDENDEKLTVEEFYTLSLNKYSQIAKRIYKNEEQEIV
jgi:hypothetical protein